MVHVHKKRYLFALLLICGIITSRVYATPMNNTFDTNPIYNIQGTDKFFVKRYTNEMRICLSPFYQQTSTSRNSAGKKVPGGDILGQWNMYALFFNQGAAPAELNFNSTAAMGSKYENYVNAGNKVNIQTSLAPDATGDRYRVGPAMIPMVQPAGLTNEANFDPEKHPFVFISVPANYEKIGLRSQFNYDFTNGLGFSIKGGIADVKYSARNFNFEDQFKADFSGIESGGKTPSDRGKEKDDAKILYDNFMAPPVRNRIAQDLELDLRQYHHADFEDLHLQVYWHWPIEFDDQSGDLGVTFVPYLALGIWLPSGEENDQNKVFSVPTGNNGFVGFSVETSMGFDFPVLPKGKQRLQGNLGGGLVAFNERNLKNVRFPSSQFQAGMIPWKISQLSTRPGLIWYFNASMMSTEFIDGLSVYFDYIYTQHLRDSVQLRDSSVTRNTEFAKARDFYVSQSSWKNQQLNIGFDYKLTDAISLGGSVQGHISGVRVHRSVTILGGITITI